MRNQLKIVLIHEIADWEDGRRKAIAFGQASQSNIINSE